MGFGNLGILGTLARTISVEKWGGGTHIAMAKA